MALRSIDWYENNALGDTGLGCNTCGNDQPQQDQNVDWWKIIVAGALVWIALKKGRF